MPTVTSANKDEHDRKFMERRGQLSKPIEVSHKKESNYLSAKTEGGEVGGKIRDKALHIHYAELDEKKRGAGIGKSLYKALIEHAHGKGLSVFSDSTVEMPAVNVYKSLEKEGYRVERRKGGGELPPDKDIPHGALYGDGPVFQIHPKNK
jgi:GNAT superfamily N-acetyltransferase